MTNLAPIAVSTYVRIEHLRSTVDRLLENPLSSQSEVYFLSDAPKQGDEKKVRKVRDYLETVKGFKNVHLIYRNSNSRTYNTREGVKRLLEQYGRVIFLEEDINTAPGFLSFMNEALDYYKGHKNVISISGYTPPLPALAKYESDVFFLRRFCAWGFATWHNKFDPFGFTIDRDIVESIFSNKHALNELIQTGQDIITMLEADLRGSIDALDVKVMLHQYLHQMYTVYPRCSLVSNIGHDGTGIHCKDTSKFDHSELSTKVSDFSFVDKPFHDPVLLKENYIFRGDNISSNIKNFVITHKMLKNLYYHFKRYI